MALTPWHDAYLCGFSYLDLPPSVKVRERPHLGDAAREILREDALGKLPCGRLDAELQGALRVIEQTGALADLRIVRYVNHNDSTGFVGYAFEAEDGSVHCAFRGSESAGCQAPNAIDWLDNFIAPFRGSVQYPDVKAFASAYEGTRAAFLGHSKGGHNALYALGTSTGDQMRSIAFNAQGFAPCQFTRAQARRMREMGTNYVVTNDLVGALMWHPERRVFAKGCEGENPHALTAFCFDASGFPIRARRPLWSYLVEVATRWYLRARSGHGENCPADAQEKPARMLVEHANL